MCRRTKDINSPSKINRPNDSCVLELDICDLPPLSRTTFCPSPCFGQLKTFLVPLHFSSARFKEKGTVTSLR